MTPAEKLPEGTDQIIEDGDTAPGFDDLPDDAPAADDAPDTESGSTGGDAKAALFGKFDDLRGQATDRAREYAQAGKDRATGALDDVIAYVEDAAGEIDARIGTQYGDYARRAADGLGNFADALRDKDVDALFADARDLVSKAPAVAVGTAAALGFVVARLLKAGVADGGTTPAAPSKKA